MDLVHRLCSIPYLWFATILTLAMLSVVTTVAAAKPDNCQTLRTEIRVTKEKTYEYNGRRIRLYCTGEVSMNKCEGACTSQVSPSVVHFPGFKKDCKCCRESRLMDKMITLDSCYDGNQLIPGQEISLIVKDPVECQCFDCAI